MPNDSMIQALRGQRNAPPPAPARPGPADDVAPDAQGGDLEARVSELEMKLAALEKAIGVEQEQDKQEGQGQNEAPDNQPA